MRKLISSLMAATLLATMPALAQAAPAGAAQGVKPAADAERGGIVQTLVVGSDIFIGDLVKTGDSGQVQILFADNTELVVGPHSSLRIEDYLLRNDGSAGQLAINMLAGYFRFATGNAPKNRYRLDTPTGTIGVRGTGFDTFIEESGISWVLHYHGIVHFCSVSGVCADLSDLCTVGRFDAQDAAIIGDSRKIKGDAREALNAQFIYSDNEAPLLARFRIPHAFDCLHNRPDVPLDDPDAPRKSDPVKPGTR